MEAPTALWATISENKSEVKPLYASMAGDDPASGKNWSSKPKQQVNAWNRTMQHTYHTYIPESYQTLPSKAATIRASSAASNKEQKFKGYSEEFLGLAKFTHFLLKCWWWSSNFWLGHFLQEEAVSSSRSMKLFFEAPFLNQGGFPNFQRRLVEVWWTGKGRHERCEAGLPSAQPFGWWVKHAKAQWICRQATERVQELNCNPDNAGFHVGFCIMFFFCFFRRKATNTMVTIWKIIIIHTFEPGPFQKKLEQVCFKGTFPWHCVWDLLEGIWRQWEGPRWRELHFGFRLCTESRFRRGKWLGGW